MLTLQSLQHQEPKAVHIFGLLQSSRPSECRMSDVLPVPRGLHKVTTVGLLVPFLWIFSSCFTTLSTTASLSRNGLSSLGRVASNMFRFCGCDQGSPLKAFPQRKSKPHKTPNGTSQRQPAAEIHCAHFSNLLHARAVGTKYNLRIALCLQQQRPWQKGRSCSSKGRQLEQQPLQYLWGSPLTVS